MGHLPRFVSVILNGLFSARILDVQRLSACTECVTRARLILVSATLSSFFFFFCSCKTSPYARLFSAYRAEWCRHYENAIMMLFSPPISVSVNSAVYGVNVNSAVYSISINNAVCSVNVNSAVYG